MEMVVMGCFILTLTDSPFLVGLIAAARMSLNVMALFAGAIAHRFLRHRILAGAEFVLAAISVAMLALLLTGRLETWHIFMLAVLGGMIGVFQMPSSQSLFADTLPPDRVGNGAAFNTLGRTIGMLIGPLLGGILFKEFGPKGAYSAIATLYFTSGLVALYIRSSGVVPRVEAESVIRTMIAGLKYVKGQQVLWGTLVLALIIESSGWTFHTTLMPVFAKNELGADSAQLGFLLFSFGLGAFAASVGWVMIGNQRNVGKLMIRSVVVWHISILVFATSDTFYLSMAIVSVTGAGFASTQVFILSALLGNAKPEFRGRVMSLRSLAIYAFAIGSMSSGAMAGFWSAPQASYIVGVMGIVLVLLLAVLAPKLRNL